MSAYNSLALENAYEQDALDRIHRRTLYQTIKHFRPFASFTLDVGDFVIKTADTVEEFIQVLELRHKIFIEDFMQSYRPGGLDFDGFDMSADHILVIDKKHDRIIGTYRLLSSLRTLKFYSQNEFTIEELMAAPGSKLELGRACIHEDYRNGASLSLVWKGIGRYISLVQPQFLFGCTSVRTSCPDKGLAILNHLKKTHYSRRFNIRPTPAYSVEEIVNSDGTETSMQTESEIEELIPSLLKTYFKAGAKVHSAPALDREFKCFDFLTVLNLDEMNPKYRQRYICG